MAITASTTASATFSKKQIQRHIGPRPGACPIRLSLRGYLRATRVLVGLAALALAVAAPAAGTEALPIPPGLVPPILGAPAATDTTAFRAG